MEPMDNNHPPSSFPQINYLIDSKLPSAKKAHFSSKEDESEEQEELKDNIACPEYLPTSRKISRQFPKNPYSILQQPILKRFSNNLNIRDSITPRGSANKVDFILPNCPNRLSDLAISHCDSITVMPGDDVRRKTREESHGHSVLEGKSRSSLITNLDDFLRNFTTSTIMEAREKTPPLTKKSRSDIEDGSLNESILSRFNNLDHEFIKDEKRQLYEYLSDFMVMSIYGNEVEEREEFLIDEETEKLQKELNEIPGLYKKIWTTSIHRECEFLQVSKMNELEKIRIDYDFFPDGFPFLKLRRNLLLLTKGTSLYCKYIVTSKTFDVISLLVILLNSLSYSLRNNQSHEYQNYLSFLAWVEDYFLFFYTIEMSLKILAFGIIKHDNSYFRDGWNILDFLVIVCLYLSYASVQDLNLSLLRLLRLLRPLKTSSAFKGLGIMLYSLFSALPLLFISFCMLSFFYSVFAIGGLQVLSGILKNRCFNQFTGILLSSDAVCGNIVCEPGFLCGRMIENPYENVISFDNLFSAYLMTLLTVTLDNWTTIMYFVLRAYSNYAWVYHVTLAIFGNYFLLNLLLAVIKVKFGESHNILSEENRRDNAKKQKYVDLIELKLDGNWEGRRFMQILKVKSQTPLKNWVLGFFEMLKYFIFEQFKVKTRILPKRTRRRSESPRHTKNFKHLGFDKLTKKRSTFANLDKYTSQIMSYFVIKDKNLIRKKSSKIDKDTNPRYLKLKVNHKKDYDAQSKDEVLERSLLRRLEAERKALELKKQKQRIVLSMKKNKNYLIDLLRGLNKQDRNCVRAIGPETTEVFTTFNKNLTRKSNSRKISQESPPHSPLSPTKSPHGRQTALIPDLRVKEDKKTNLALIHSNRMRNSALMKVKMSTQIDDNEAYILTFKSSPSSNSRSLSKSQTHTYSVLGYSGSKIADNASARNNNIGMGLVSKLRNRNFKIKDPEYIFFQAMLNEPFDNEVAQKEKYVEENMNYILKYTKIMMPRKGDSDLASLTWSAQEILGHYPIDRFEKVILQLNLDKLEEFQEEVRFRYRRFRKKVNEVLRLPSVEKFVLLTVLTYLLLLSMVGIITDRTVFLLDIAFNILFSFEMGLRILGFGVQHTLQDRSNFIEIFIIMGTYLFFFLDAVIPEFNYSRFIYTFKVFRVTRLFHKIQFIQTLLSLFSKALSSFVYLLFLLVIFNFVYALIGMQLFGGRFNKADDRYSKFNFDTFWLSIVTTFDIITLDNWIDILALGFNSKAGAYVTGVFAFSWIFLGNFVLLNLFLAILLESVTQNLSDKEEITNKEDENEEPSNQASLKFVVNKEAGEKIMDELSKCKGEKAREFANSINIDKMKKKSIVKNLTTTNVRRSSYRAAFVPIKSLDQLYCENSLFIFSKTNKLRLTSYKIVSHSAFERFMNVVIFFSSLILILETYVDFNSDDEFEIILADFCWITNLILAVIYFGEILLKAITFGFCLDRRSYLRNYWNLLDFVLSICYIGDVFTPEDSDSVIVKAMKVMKVFRPIKIIIVNQNIRIALSSLLISTYSIANVLVFIFVVWLVFAILGTIMFRDRFGFCENKLNYGVSKQMCLNQQKEWKVYSSNFDNIGHTLLTLFIISTLDGWCDVMSIAISSDIESHGPKRFNNEYSSYAYFLIFVLIGTMLILNLFISVIFMDFVKEQKRLKHKFLSDSQVAWINIQTLIIEAKPNFQYNRPPKNRFRRFLFLVFTFWATKLVFYIFIILDIMVLSAYLDSTDKTYKYNMELIHLLFNLFFLIECALKLLAFGKMGYFHDGWNRFEFLIMLTILVDVSVFSLYQNLFLSINYVVRVIQGARALKILRLLKIFYKIKSVQKLLQTLKLSLPMVLNIFALLMLVYYIYVIFGCIYFKHITSGDVIDDYINFKNFAYGLMTMFKVATADGWEGIMYDVMDYHSWAWVYFVSFYIITTEVMINLFILVLLSQFDDYYANSENPMHTFKENLGKFRKVWSLLTMEQEGKKMHKDDILKFFKALKPPLGYHNIDEELEYIYREIMLMNLKSDSQGFLRFNDVLFATMKKTYRDQVNLLLNEISRKKIEQIERKTLTKLHYLHKTNKSYKLKKTQNNNRFETSIFDEEAIIVFNPLSKHLYGKLCFNAWRMYSEGLIEKLSRCEFGEQIYFEDDDSVNGEEEEDNEKWDDSRSSLRMVEPSQKNPRHLVSKIMTPRD